MLMGRFLSLYLTEKIYITGGFDGHDCINTAEVYDPNTNQWTMITAMRSRRSGVSCISYHGCVYVIGINSHLLLQMFTIAALNALKKKEKIPKLRYYFTIILPF